jgi:hypothetical protein
MRKCAKSCESFLKSDKVCYKLGNLLKAEVNLGKISEDASMLTHLKNFLHTPTHARDHPPPAQHAHLRPPAHTSMPIFVLLFMQFKVCPRSTKV